METPNKTTAAPAAATADRTVTTFPRTHLTGRLTRMDRDRLFNAAAAGMTPERQRDGEDPVKQWLPQIRRKYKEGYSARQILAMTQAPGIGLKLSLRTLQRLMKPTARAKRPVTAAQA